MLSDPPPAALYVGRGRLGGQLTVAGWMDQSTHDFLRVRSEAIRVVLMRMGEDGVDLPEPTLRLRRAPVAALAGAGERSPARDDGGQTAGLSTHRDLSLNAVVERERKGRSDLLDPARPEE